MTTTNSAYEIRADQLRPGMVFLGPRQFRTKAETVQRTATSVIVTGVNGFGEGVKHRYKHRAPVTAFPFGEPL